jgi:hypothetical protein
MKKAQILNVVLFYVAEQKNHFMIIKIKVCIKLENMDHLGITDVIFRQKHLSQ